MSELGHGLKRQGCMLMMVAVRRIFFEGLMSIVFIF